MYSYKKSESFTIEKHIRDLERDATTILTNASSSGSAMVMGCAIRELHSVVSFAVSDFKKEITNLDKMFNPAFIAPDKAELNKVLTSVVKNIKATARATNEEFKQAVYDRSQKMVSIAPTQEQLNLLSVLRMRTDIGQAELQMIGTAVAGNYQATRVVKDIAKAQGCSMTTPLLNIEDIHAMIEDTYSYLDSAIECIDLTDVPMGKRFFFRINKENPNVIGDPYFSETAMKLDGSPELKSVTVHKEALNASEQAKIDFYFRSIKQLDMSKTENLSKLENLVDTIIREHPEDIALLRMSEYAGEIKNAEKKRATTILPDDMGSRHFTNMTHLESYIRHSTQGLEGKERTDKINSILASCPKQHTYAWDYFTTYGEKPAWENQSATAE